MLQSPDEFIREGHSPPEYRGGYLASAGRWLLVGTLVFSGAVALPLAAYAIVHKWSEPRELTETTPANTTIVVKQYKTSRSSRTASLPPAAQNAPPGAQASHFDPPPDQFLSARQPLIGAYPEAELAFPSAPGGRSAFGSHPLQRSLMAALGSEVPEQREEAAKNEPALMYASAPSNDPDLTPRPDAPFSLPEMDGRTAVYDIEAHTVYMPSGEKLEAHSGLGARLDDTRYVHEKNRGPTPPDVYNLKLRESLFHGVQAVRLTPASGRDPHGRTGLLAHTYMLGPRGDSNGCVSVKDYPKFLQAVTRGEVTRLVVVKRMKEAPSFFASSGVGRFFRYAFGG